MLSFETIANPPKPFTKALSAVAMILAFAALCLEFGFELSGAMDAASWRMSLIPGFLFFALFIRQAAFAPRRIQFLLFNKFEALVWLALIGTGGMWTAALIERMDLLRFRAPAETLFANLYSMALLFWFIKYLIEWIRANMPERFSPAQLAVATFAALIGVGCFLLLLPAATHGATAPNISLIDALFTATSAVCVTGLIVVDTASDFSRFGQWILLALFQIGGFGIMVFVSLSALLAGRREGLKQRMMLTDLLRSEQAGDVRSVLWITAAATLILETLGTLALYGAFRQTENGANPGWFDALFHSVSAFCNAGFSTFSDSLESYQTTLGVIYPVMALIVFGGLGFPVIRECLQWSRGLLSFRAARSFRFSVHSKAVGVTSLALLILGALFAGFGYAHEGLSWLEWFHIALFQSVTVRTAGFNTIPFADLAAWSIVGMLVLMMIGGAPGGTAGGIKVSTVAILFIAAKNTFRGNERVEAFHRTIPLTIIKAAFVISGLSVLYVAMAIMAMAWAEPEIPFLPLAFETVSAFGTVGVSMGITSQLSTMGKLILIITMFLGRIGPVTLFLAMMHRQTTSLYQYPTESIQVG